MSCQEIITQPPAVLTKNDTVCDAVVTLRQLHVAALPVVDAKGHFVGVFGLREVIALLLPRAVRLGDDLDALRFLAESLDELKARLGSLGKDPVGKHMAPHRSVRAETPLVEALLLLYRGDSYLPVVDGAGKLVGVVTAAQALARIAGDA